MQHFTLVHCISLPDKKRMSEWMQCAVINSPPCRSLYVRAYVCMRSGGKPFSLWFWTILSLNHAVVSFARTAVVRMPVQREAQATTCFSWFHTTIECNFDAWNILLHSVHNEQPTDARYIAICDENAKHISTPMKDVQRAAWTGKKRTIVAFLSHFIGNVSESSR